MNSAKYKKSPKIVERTIRGEKVIVPLANSEKALDSIYTLNETAGVIWDNACNGFNEKQIAESLIEKFDIDPDTAISDVSNTISEFIKLGLLIRIDE